MLSRILGSMSAAGIVLLSLAGCGDGPTTPEFEVIEEVAFDASLDIDLSRMTRTSTGLYYEDLIVGTGEPARTGDLAEVAFTGWLRTGVQFDSGQFSFVVDSGQLIQGFNDGVRGMAVGGRRKIVVPPGLAYGARGSGIIPGGAILVFEIDLISIG